MLNIWNFVTSLFKSQPTTTLSCDYAPSNYRVFECASVTRSSSWIGESITRCTPPNTTNRCVSTYHINPIVVPLATTIIFSFVTSTVYLAYYHCNRKRGKSNLSHDIENNLNSINENMSENDKIKISKCNIF